MDYGQFLMECVDEYSTHEEIIWEAQGGLDDDRLDQIAATHDEMIMAIECYFYVDHKTEECLSWNHADEIIACNDKYIMNSIDESWSKW